MFRIPVVFPFLYLSSCCQANGSANPTMGGICERPMQSHLNFNVLALTVLNEVGKRVPDLMVALSLAHELGHSFGSEHDNDSVSLMLPYSLSGRVMEHYTFSEHSREMIHQVLLNKGYCLERDYRPFCGNGNYAFFLSKSGFIIAFSWFQFYSTCRTWSTFGFFESTAT